MRTTTWLGVLLAVGMVLGFTWDSEAQGRADTVREKLMAADANNDGQLTYDEMSKVAPRMTRERFARMDRNGDGVLSRADRQQAGAQGRHRMRPRTAPGVRDDANRGGQPGAMLRRADANNDGQITFEELSSVAPQLTRDRFARLDRNGDGVLSAADRPEGAGEGQPGAMLRRADANEDGQITFEELSSVAPQLTRDRFARLDRNGDGVLSAADRRAAAGRPGERGGPGNRDGRAAAQMRERLMAADANGDGKVSYDEATASRPGFPRSAFDRADRNGDGYLSAEDLAGRQGARAGAE